MIEQFEGARATAAQAGPAQDTPAKTPTLVEQLAAAEARIAALEAANRDLGNKVDAFQTHQGRRDKSEDGREERLVELERRLEKLVLRIGFAGEA